MANSTDEYWDIDGVSLSQYGWSVATVGGARYDLPTRRGDDVSIAYRPGALFRPKLPEPRVINLVMWLTGTTPGTGAAVADQSLQWNDSWDVLRRLVWKPGGARVTLTRRWYLTIGAVKTLVSASADAEIVDTMAPSMTGRTRADFTMSLKLTDPYFYGPQVAVTVNTGAPTVINNPGHDIAMHNHLQVDFVPSGGGSFAATLTNTTPTPDVFVQYSLYQYYLTGAPLAPTTPPAVTATLDVPTFAATAGGANVISRIRQGGSRYWMVLMPGNNSLTLTAEHGTGHAVVRYRPPYI